MQSRNSSNYKGIDVSNHNYNIDFSAVKNSGIQLAYIKSTEGRTMQDAYFRQNYNNAKANGLKVGFYHFYHSDSDVTQQVQNFINVTQGCQPDLKVAIDVEITNNVDNATRCVGLLEFARQVKEKTGWDCCLYTYTYFAKNNLNSSVASLPLWIAEYGIDQPKDNGIWNSWVGFQYSESGSISGVNGRCDVNEFNDGIFLNGANSNIQPVATQPQTYQGLTNFTHSNNAQIVGDDLFIRDRNGNQIKGRYVSNGDKVTVLDVGFTSGLCLVEYPTPSGVRSGYVKNVVSLIHYFNPYNWLNGKTPERVFDRPNGNVIGLIDPHEKATILYIDRVTGWTNVVYSTQKGEFTKSGFVQFKGL